MDASWAGRPVIIGGGLAGLSCALALAPIPVVLLVKSPLGQDASSAWAQGGVAVATGTDDSVACHVADTLAAGDGLCDVEAVERIIGLGPQAVRRLEGWGVSFDRHEDGSYSRSLEAAHSVPRVLHAGGGDTAGARIMQAVIAKARATPSIAIVEGAEVRNLLTDEAGIAGVEGVVGATPFQLATRRVVLATGGSGGLWRHTTNPATSLGQGLVLAARAGAALVDIEFMQFHPTGIDLGFDPMPLASEALRGDGAILIDGRAHAIMTDHPQRDLAPRDVVARAVWRSVSAGERVFLDARHAVGSRFPERFPTIYAACLRGGLDPVREPIPVRPAAHYHMGGVEVGASGRSSVAGLWACGEASATGLHGANRLASNSLLEAVVTGTLVAEDVAGMGGGTEAGRLIAPQPAAAPVIDAHEAQGIAAVRDCVSRHLGVSRDRDGLVQAVDTLSALLRPGRAGDAALMGLMIAVAAFNREESRGSHDRRDFPAERRHSAPVRKPITLSEVLGSEALAQRTHNTMPHVAA
ncbi:MAG TPA: L-aspartate oxidase [Stellaceae bacterium]|nr:L-aspartate oxidase [Stellaceae bacterium]